VENALAFDAEDFSTVNTAFLLANLTKSLVIEGFEFTSALEHSLKENTMLRKHSAVIHLAPDQVMRYVWAHKEYQPWGRKIPAQCPQCGSLNPWEMASQGKGVYGVECKNTDCGVVRGRNSGRPHTFQAICPAGGELLTTSGNGSWMKEPVY
jgi:hypothetical protein